jgi:hypothetical protein
VTLQVSQAQNEGVYQASKWLKIQVLLDAEEMRDLILALGSFWIFPLTGMVDGKPIDSTFFVEEYSRWIEQLKKGEIPSSQELRNLLPCAFVDTLDSLWLQEVAGGKKICKIRKPVVQVQAHFFSYSSLDEVFRPMSLGLNSVFWGMQFSFPQIYQDPKTMELCSVKEGVLYRKIQLWIREKTSPTPFVVDGKKTNVPIRLGKNCFSWIKQHSQLINQNIGVYTHG